MFQRISVMSKVLPDEPMAFNWLLPFRHTLGGVADAVTDVGKAMVTMDCAVSGQPAGDVPVTV